MMSNERDLERRVRELEEQVAVLKQRGGFGYRGVRRRSSFEVAGLPLWEIASGPDPETGSMRGHARAIFAIGDLATGVVAIGGLARGVFALGGCALGLVSMGGFSIGVLLAVGGLAIGGVAFGGGAVGGIAIGGGAVGMYACGGGAAGSHVISPGRRDPEAMGSELVAVIDPVVLPRGSSGSTDSTASVRNVRTW
jgi:hypothetical protein